MIAAQHRGPTTLDNLALACYDCNRSKGPNIASVDPQTDQSAFLFNPRRDIWAEHFRLEAGCIAGITPAGRATAALLQFNTTKRIRLRVELHKAGRYPREASNKGNP
jgi:hypothetical protein